MEFKQGDRVEVWDEDGQQPRMATYFAFDGISEVAKYRHWAMVDSSGGICPWNHCRKARPNLKVDDPVWVRNEDDCRWICRHFKGWEEDAGIICFNSGTTSHSSETLRGSSWKYYRTTPPEEEK